MRTLNPAYVVMPFKQSLADCQTNVLLGLRLVEKIERFPDPTNEELQFMQLYFGGKASSIGQTKEQFKRWLLLRGFEDIHTCIRTTLERLFVFKALQNEVKTNPTLDVGVVEACLKDKANKFNYPPLVAAVHEQLGDTLTYEKHCETINNARNCLVHRNGEVTVKDCNNIQNDKLIISGNRFKMFFKKGEEEIPAEIGKLGPENAALMLGAEEFEIQFRIGERVDISLKQFVDILNTCIFFNADIEEKIGVGKT